jgi:hypothetical protein
VYGKVIL